MINLTKTIGNQDFLSKLNLNIALGQSVAIYCTYETARVLTDILLGRNHISSGEILFDGRSAGKDIAERVVFALYDEKANPKLKVKEYLRFWSRMFNSKKRIDQVASLVGLTASSETLIAKLSDSEQIRLQWARCLLQDHADIVFIEQSVQYMDHESLEILQSVIAFLKQENKSVLIMAASAEQAAVLGDQTYRLVNGELLPLQPVEDKTDKNDHASARKMMEIGKIPVKQDDKIVLLNPLDINYIESQDGNAVVYVGDRSYVCAMTLNQLESRLDPFGFFRCHRSYLVNLQQVREIEAWTKDSYILKMDGAEGQSVPLSKTKFLELKEQLNI